MFNKVVEPVNGGGGSVTCHLSHDFFFYIFFYYKIKKNLKFFNKVVEPVNGGGGSVINRAYPINFYNFTLPYAGLS